METLQGKKLLVLNGNFLSCDIIEKARQMGIYTIVTDWYEDSPAKKIADESYMISISDTKALVKLVKEKGINGIYTQYTDSSLPYCLKACKELGFPFFVTEEQLEGISNKELSKKLCEEYNIPVSKRYYVSDNLTDDDIKTISQWPVLTKPVDNSGQRGITICNNEKELREGYLYAKKNSLLGKAIVEEYMQGDYLVICFTLQDGNLTLSCLADKPVLSKELAHGNIRLPKAYVMPSKYLDLFYKKAFPRFEKMAKGLGLKNGSWSIECVCRNNDFYVFEMQFRLGGMKHHNFVLKENGVDLLEMHLRFALTGKFEGYNLKKSDNPYYKHTYSSLNILLKKGIITSIEGIEDTKKLSGVISMNMMHKVGDKVEEDGTVFQILAKYSLEVDSKKQLSTLIQEIYSKLSVKDENNNEMIFSVWTPHDLNDL